MPKLIFIGVSEPFHSTELTKIIRWSQASDFYIFLFVGPTLKDGSRALEEKDKRIKYISPKLCPWMEAAKLNKTILQRAQQSPLKPGLSNHGTLLSKTAPEISPR